MDGKVEQPGVTHDLIPITQRVDGSIVGMPVITVTGSQSGPKLLVVGGTHGDEQEGIATVLELVEQVAPERLSGTLICVTTLNLFAYEEHRRGTTRDDWFYDMNRLFPGSATGSLTERTANLLCTELVPQADCVIAVHSGGSNIYCCPRTIISSDDERHVELARAMGPGWEIIAIGVGERTTISSLTAWAGSQGKASVTIELGGVSHRLPGDFARDVEMITGGIINVMRHYKMLPGEATYADEYQRVFYQPIRNNQGGFFRFTENCQLKKWVKQGDVFFTVHDMFGNEVERVVAPRDCMPVAVPGKVSAPTGGAHVMSVAWPQS